MENLKELISNIRELHSMAKRVEKLEATIARKDEALLRKKEVIAQKDEIITRLKAELSEARTIKTTSSVKEANPVIKVGRKPVEQLSNWSLMGIAKNPSDPRYNRAIEILAERKHPIPGVKSVTHPVEKSVQVKQVVDKKPLRSTPIPNKSLATKTPHRSKVIKDVFEDILL